MKYFVLACSMFLLLSPVLKVFSSILSGKVFFQINQKFLKNHKFMNVIGNVSASSRGVMFNFDGFKEEPKVVSCLYFDTVR